MGIKLAHNLPNKAAYPLMSELMIFGGIRNRQINRDQIQQLQANKQSSSIERLWDALLDFVTQSNVSVAKSLCTKIFHSKDSSEKIKSFLSLRSLSYEHCQSQFIIQPSQKPNTIRLCITSLNISLEVAIESDDAASLMNQVKAGVNAEGSLNIHKQFKGDISRWNYHLELMNGDTVDIDRKNTQLTNEQKMEHWQRLSFGESKSSSLEFLGSQLLPQSMALWSVQTEQINRGVPNLTIVNSEVAEQQCSIIDFGEGDFWVEYYTHSEVEDEHQESAKIGALCKELTLHSGFLVTPEIALCCLWEHKGIPF
ncbi:hypothetical protein D5R81_10370 [Parashewanella spongiae]|uniref:Uncharacterized protein n=1 Tax=Parashewanella spongiae TaxID=342950 RepID=A0A3A6TZS0_9GAMM|nr:hypothetical protein [Parashewanella spongiae]MCL1079576.1 hypothetical protein [Parashewanella spongiae]RJY14961.1 hypothetical protein D5R81_10370 [Parashewanella spongiae]